MITVQVESDGVDLPNIDGDWMSRICNNILKDFEHSKAAVTIIFSTDLELRKLIVSPDLDIRIKSAPIEGNKINEDKIGKFIKE